MKERDLAGDFTDIFKAYQLHIPVNNSVAGWPDRFVQIQSRVIACELKVIKLIHNKTNVDSYFRLNEFRQTQAAWLAKWQAHGGLCFLFIGVIDANEFIGYICFSCKEWRDWLYANKAKYTLANFELLTNHHEVLTWFDRFSRDRDQAMVRQELTESPNLV